MVFRSDLAERSLLALASPMVLTLTRRSERPVKSCRNVQPDTSLGRAANGRFISDDLAIGDGVSLSLDLGALRWVVGAWVVDALPNTLAPAP